MDEGALARRILMWFDQRGYETEPADLAGVPCTVARTSEFRWKWFATRLHVFVFVAPIAQAVDSQLAELLSGASVEYAKSNKRGLPVGMQTGVAAIPMLVSSTIEEPARAWAQERPRKYFGALCAPVLIDAGTGQRFTYEGTMVWGASYARFLRELVAGSVGSAVTA